MDSHVKDCLDCQAIVERGRALDGLLEDGLTHPAEPSSVEHIKLCEAVLEKVARPQLGHWGRQLPRLAGLTAFFLAVVLAGVMLLHPGQAPPVSVAELITQVRAVADAQVGLNGVLHWIMEMEQYDPATGSLVAESEVEIWFDLDDPGLYHMRNKMQGVALHQFVRDGVDHYWFLEQVYGQDANTTPQADEVLLSPEEMVELAAWHVPSPFCNELEHFADLLPEVELDGEPEIAGRRAYVLRGKLLGLATTASPHQLEPIPVQVTLYVDAETYWLLGRQE